MAFIQFITLCGLIIAFFFGQLTRVSIGYISFPIIDIFIVFLAIFNLFNHPQIKNKPLVWFLIYAWINLFINFFIYKYPLLAAISYLIRLTCILSLIIYPPQISSKIKYFFILALISNILFGLIQYLLWPDFTYFKALNWDDHLSRLVSTYFDPTFTALIYLMFFIFLYLQKNKSTATAILILFTYLAMALTYSRSTFLAFIICSVFVGYKLKNIKIFIFGLCLILATILLLPRPPGEGTKLERTSSINAKYINLNEGLSLFAKSPLIGLGYNNLPSIRNLNTHSSSGFDASLLTILVTTGTIGLFLFTLGFKIYFDQISLTKQTILLAVFVHSLFANSLLYPYTLIFLVLI